MTDAPAAAAVEPLVPDYSGANVCRLVPELLGDRAAPWLPEAAGVAGCVVLLLVDGVGWNELGRHASHLPNLSSLAGAAISTVAPATTSAALTSIATGLPPGQHGITGFRMRMGTQVLNTLRWTVDRGKPPPPSDVQRHAAFLGRPVPALTKAEFRTSGFTRAHLDGARFVGCQTTTVLVEHVRRLARAGERLVFAYYSGPDEVAHAHGIRDEFYAMELEFVDGLVARLLDALPSGAALLVTSDHGQVHLDADDWIEMPDLAPMIEAQAGDARFRSMYARDGARDDLLAAAREQLGARAWVRSRAEVLREGWLGPDPTPGLGGRIGDVVLAARDPVGFVDPSVPYERNLRSAHGSPTPDEILVPLLAGMGAGT